MDEQCSGTERTQTAHRNEPNDMLMNNGSASGLIDILEGRGIL